MDRLSASVASPVAGEAASCRRAAGTRVRVARPSTLRADDSGPLDVRVEDLSPAGFSFTGNTPIAMGALVHVGLAGAGRASARIAWQSGGRHGCLFQPVLTPEQIAAAFTHSPDAPAVTSVAMAADHGPAQAPTMRTTTLAPAARVILLLLLGGLGWSAIAVGLRTAALF